MSDDTIRPNILDMSGDGEPSPRINGAMMESFLGQTVRVTGKLVKVSLLPVALTGLFNRVQVDVGPTVEC